MTSAYFHDGELNTFINETTGLNANDLLERYREDITANKITRATNGLRRKLRDYLDSKGVPCGKGTGDLFRVDFSTFFGCNLGNSN
jgi:hypothetical protein